MATSDYHVDLTEINRIHGAIQSIRIGTVEHTAVGTNADVTVVIQGNPPEVVFNFKIPQGNTGANGSNAPCRG